MAKVVDANIIIRFLVEDTPGTLEKLRKFLSSEKLILTDVTIAEIVWVLDSFYKLPKQNICDKIAALVDFPNFTLNRPVISRAIMYFRNHTIDYIDAYLLAFAKENGYGEIASYDRSLDKIKETKRIEP